MSTTNEKDANSQDEVILAIRKIIEAEQALMSDGEELHEASDAVQSRIEAALHRLAGDGTPEHAPTVLEALILERLEPCVKSMDGAVYGTDGGTHSARRNTRADAQKLARFLNPLMDIRRGPPLRFGAAWCNSK